MIVVGVELPVEKVPGRSDAKRVADDRRSAMRRGTQAYNLWTDRDRPVVTVPGPVIESNLYAHPPSCGPSPEFLVRSHFATNPERCQGSRGTCCCKATLTTARGGVQFSDHCNTFPGLKGLDAFTAAVAAYRPAAIAGSRQEIATTLRPPQTPRREGARLATA